jgi:hypothetical protein
MRWHSLLALAILGLVFWLNFADHYAAGFPMHVDSWQMTTMADAIIKGGGLPSAEPFSGTPRKGPDGNPVLQAVLSGITSMSLLKLSVLMPALLNLGLAMLMYALAKLMFSNKEAGLAVMAFQPLVLSQITMLGPFFLVNLAFGMVLCMLAAALLLRRRWVLFLLVFAAVGFTHMSSFVFLSIATAVFFGFDRPNWRLLPLLAGLGLLAGLIFILVKGWALLELYLSNLFTFGKAWPYFQYINMLGPLFLVLLALGFYMANVKEPKARRFLIPLFSLLALNMLSYWVWRGFFLVYRRLISFMFLLTPFFVGYAVVSISGVFKRYRGLALACLLLLLVPLASMANLASRTPYILYITAEEHELFTGFGTLHPGAHILTDHLEGYAMPFYNLRPISLSPAHGANTTYYHQVGKCYLAGSLDCISQFFTDKGFLYLYTGRPINDSRFEAIGGHTGIYKHKIYNAEANYGSLS